VSGEEQRPYPEKGTGVPPEQRASAGTEAIEQHSVEDSLTVDLSGSTSCSSSPTLDDRTELQHADLLAGGPDPPPARPDDSPTCPSGVVERPGGLRFVTPPAIAGYRVIQKLGEGTYGQVWLHEEERTGKQVAIKFFTSNQGLQWLLLQAEVKQLALLHADPGIIQLLDVEPEARPPYYIMSYASGGSLAQQLNTGHPLSVPVALKIFREVVTALAYVHAKRVRHCDLKPGNVLLDGRGRALLADFGQSSLNTADAPALGTFFYMAPEQADLRNTIPDARWDVYGLGALFHAMLLGRPPRESPPVRDELASIPNLERRLACYREAVLHAPPPTEHRRLPGMDRDLSAIIDRCLEVDPDRRFRDAGAVLAALDRRVRNRRRRPLVVFGLLAPLLLLVALVSWSYWSGEKEIRAAQAHLIQQIQESDRVSARLVANVVHDHLQERIAYLKAFSASQGKQLRQALKKGQDVQPLLQKLDEEEKGRDLFYQYWLVDRQGFVRAGFPELPGQVQGPGKRLARWAYRDWFNGMGDQHRQKQDWFPPVRTVHVSQPYVSRVPGKEYLSINVTVPLFEAGKDSQVAGLLTGQIRVADLHTWLEGVEIPHGMVVLLNERGHCLRHDRLDRIRPPEDRNPQDWRQQSDLYRQALRNDPGKGLADYRDPIAGKNYLGGYSPFPHREKSAPIGWVALVEQERAEILRPVGELYAKLRRDCLIALITGTLVVGSLWSWLFLTLRREQTTG
jgi:serine/threonine protein kinase